MTAVLLFVNAAGAQVSQALDLVAEGRYEEATRMLQPLQQDPMALYALARIALIENRHEDAANLLQHAIAKERSNASVSLIPCAIGNS